MTGALPGLGFDAPLHRLGFPHAGERDGRLAEPSELADALAVVLLAAAQACENLGLFTRAAPVDGFIGCLFRHVLVAMSIVGLGPGGWVRDLLAARAALAGEARPTSARWLGEFARCTVPVFAFTAAVHQHGAAQDFVRMTFGLLFGAPCLAAALAFGLGARDVAGDMIRRRHQQVEPGAPLGPTPRAQERPVRPRQQRPVPPAPAPPSDRRTCLFGHVQKDMRVRRDGLGRRAVPPVAGLGVSPFAARDPRPNHRPPVV